MTVQALEIPGGTVFQLGDSRVRLVLMSDGTPCRDHRGRLAVRNVETNRLSYVSERRLSKPLAPSDPPPARIQEIEVDYLTPLTRFINRSRVRPTDGQIDHALRLIARLRDLLAAQSSDPRPAARLQGIIAEMRSERSRYKSDPRGFTDSVGASAVDEWADELEALLAARSADPPPAPPPCVWQDISSAPKDGTPVILYWREELGDDVVDIWACGYWREFGDGSKGWIGESFHSSQPKTWTRLIGELPTHWMPIILPTAPGEECTNGQ